MMRRRPIIEQLEPRILYSADTGPILAAAVVGPPAAEHRVIDTNGEFAAQSEQAVQYAPHEVVFIDARTPDYALLVRDIAAQSARQLDVVMLSGDRDGVQQITDALAGRENVAAVHIIAHGGDGIVQLGPTAVTAASLQRNPLQVEAWAKALTADADILLYGCDVAATAQGQQLVDALARLTGADVAASDDPTGDAKLGGNWNLEFASGPIEAQVALSQSAQELWSGVLATVTVTTTADQLDGDTSSIAALLVTQGADGKISLREAVIATNATAGADTISLAAGTYTLSRAGLNENAASTGDLDITDALTINGAAANTTLINGGGLDRVFEVRGATVAMSGLTIQNGSVADGAGMYVDGSSSVTLRNSVLSGNLATGNGGAMFLSGTLVLDSVTIDGNQANQAGGIYVNNGSTATMTNVTISGNTSTGNGGAIIARSTVNLTNSTIADNIAGSGAGGIHTAGSGDASLKNTILANNTGGNANGALTSLGNNIDSANTAGLSGAGDKINTDPLLGALQANGGPTRTHALLAGSPAINAGTAVGAPALDQRGGARDATPDIGAYEFGAAVNAAPVVDLNAGGAGQDVTVAFIEQTPVLIAPVATLADVDSANLASLTATLTARPDGDAVESLALNAAATAAAGGLTVSYTAATGVLSITGSASVAAYQTILQGIQYNNTSDAPNTGNRAVTVVANDGALPSATQNSTITVTVVNDAPAGTNTTLATLEDTAYTFSAANFGFTDPGDSPVNALTAVKITTLPGAGALALSGVAVSAGDFVSVADINAGNLMFTPAANANGAGYTTFTFQVQDDGGTANSGVDLDATPRTMTVNVTAVNDAPVITSNGGGASASLAVAENSTAVTTITSTDVDGGAPVYSILAGADGAKFTINSGTGALSFITAPDYENPSDAGGNNVYDLTVQVSDGSGGTDTQAIAVTVTDIADGIRITPISVVPLGSETRVNTTTVNDQAIAANVAQAMATDASGNFVVVWASNLQDGAAYGIYAQRYSADGTAQGGEFRVNTTTADTQLLPSVAMDASGKFVVAWSSNLQDGSGYGVYAQRYNAAGTAQGSEFLVNTTTAGSQIGSAIAMSPTGAFVISWSGSGQDPDASSGIYAQRFDASGAAQGGEFRVNTYTTNTQQLSSVSMDGAGNFVVTWASNGQDGSNYGVYGQRYDAGGAAQGAEFRVNTTTANSQLYNDVVMLPDGRFVVAFQSVSADGSFEVYLQRYAADGTATGGETHVNAVTVTSAQQPIPSVCADASGNIIVVWNSSADGAGVGVIGRCFDWSGTPLGGEFQVNTTSAGDQLYAEVVSQPGGRFIVAWGGNGSGDADGVFMQRYGLATTEAGGTATFSVVLEAAPTADVVIPVSVPDSTEGTAPVAALTFTNANWNIAQTITVTGVQDYVNDGNVAYTAVLGAATSTDPNFNGLNPADLAVTNLEVANLAPVNTVPGAQTVNEDAALVFSSGNGNALSIGDADAGGNAVQVTLSVTNGTLMLAGVAGLAFSTGDGTADTTMTFTGTVADINSALNGLRFDPTANFNGSAILSINTSDQGNTGTGGALSDADSVAITVSPVNDAPVGSNRTVTTLEDTAYTLTAADFGFTDPSDSPVNALLNVKIATLPGSGTLALSGVAVTAGDFVSVANITAGNLKFTPVPNANGAAYSTFTFQVQDDGGTANGGVDLDATPNTLSVNVTAVNDAPAGTSNTVTTLEDTAYTFSAANFGFTDPTDAASAAGANALTAVKITTLPGAGALALSGVAVSAGDVVSVANINAGNLKFTPAANANGAAYAAFTFQVQDDGGTANSGVDLDAIPNTLTVNVTAVNDAPTVAGANTIAYTENDPATALNPGIAVADVDSAGLASATVTITNFVAGEDVLSLTLNAATMGNIAIAGNAGGVLTLNSAGNSATPAQFAAALAAVSYTNTSDNPGTTPRNVSYAVNDGSANSVTVATTTVNITAVNDAPTVTSANTIAYTENDAATALNPGITVADVDSAGLASATATVSANYVNGEDVLSFTAVPATMGNITGSFDAATGALTLTSAGNTATPAQFAAALAAVKYANTSDNPGTAARTLSYAVNDGSANSVTAATTTLNITAVNDAPTVAGANTIAYTENDPATALNPGIAVADVDSAGLASATVTITNFVAGEDVLSLTLNAATMGNIAIAGNAGGVLTLNSAGNSATPAQFAAALAAVSYTNTSDNPGTTPRNVSYAVNDGTSGSVSVATTTVMITAVNDDAPVLAGANNLATITEDPVVNGGTLVSALIAGQVTDIDSGGLGGIAVTAVDNTNGAWQYSTDGGGSWSPFGSPTGAAARLLAADAQTTVRFVPNADFNGAVNSGISFRAWDQFSGNAGDTADTTANGGTTAFSSATASAGIMVTAVNDAPTIVSANTIAYTENDAATALNPGITVADVDSAGLASATATLGANYVNDEDVLSFTALPATMGNITASFDAASGTLTLSSAGNTATPAQFAAALAAVQYTNTSDNPGTAARTVSYAVNDGSANSVSLAKTTLNITAVNDAPTVVSANAIGYTENDAATALNPAITVADADSAGLASATVTVSANYVNGEDVFSFTAVPATMGNITGSFDAASGTLTLSSAGNTATPAQFTAALAAVKYTNTSDNPGTAARTVSYAVNDGAANSVTAATTAVNITAVNDAPTVAVSGGSTLFMAGGGAVALDPALTVGEPDSATLPSARVWFSGLEPAGDMLYFSNNPATMGNIAGSYNTATGVLALSSAGATATPAQWQAALRTVTYANVNPAPDTATRTVSLALSDGAAFSPVVTRTVSVSLPAPVTTVADPQHLIGGAAAAAATIFAAETQTAIASVAPAIIATPTTAPQQAQPAAVPSRTAAPAPGTASAEGADIITFAAETIRTAVSAGGGPLLGVVSATDARVTSLSLRLAAQVVAAAQGAQPGGDLLADVVKQADVRPVDLFQLEERSARATGAEGLGSDLARLRDSLREQDEIQSRTVVTLTAGSLTVTLAYLVWLIRGGALAASVLSALPAWRLLDPLPILARGDGEEDESDEEDDPAIASFSDATGEVPLS